MQGQKAYLFFTKCFTPWPRNDLKYVVPIEFHPSFLSLQHKSKFVLLHTPAIQGNFAPKVIQEIGWPPKKQELKAAQHIKGVKQ